LQQPAPQPSADVPAIRLPGEHPPADDLPTGETKH
jgi:hypothetical protein